MAGAVRPAVLLIVFASLLFMLTGWLDASDALSACGFEPLSRACLDAAASPGESILFGLINLFVAVLIARGSERMLGLRILLAAFFVLERPITALAFGPKPIESIGLHLVTAFVEAVILLSTLRIWRLGHSVTQVDLAALQITTPVDVTTPPVIDRREGALDRRSRAAR